MTGSDPFRAAAHAYFAYGAVYLVGGAYLVFHGVGVRGDQAPGSLGTVLRSAWVLAGLALLVLIPFLLRRPRAWFARWILSRRDFARLLSVFMAVRAWQVLKVALRPETASVPAPWGGEVSFRAGAMVFFVVTLTALAFIVRAAWSAEERDERVVRLGVAPPVEQGRGSLP